jgi:carboxyl-terminal processing protease
MRYRPAFGELTLPWPAFVAMLVVIGVGAFSAGFALALRDAQGREGALRVFWEAHRILNREFYYDRPAPDAQINAAAGAAVGALVKTFDDPYTLYLPPADAAQETRVMEGEVGGIGALVAQTDDNAVIITEARLGWPAEAAGMRVGDTIIAVNGVNVEGQPLGEVVAQIRGPLGTEVAVTVRRPGVTEPITMTMKRTQINVFSTVLDGNIAYLSLDIFSRDADQLIVQQLEALLARKPRALIFDLRNNRGGYLDQAIKVADIFLTEGKIATEKTSDGRNETFNADNGDVGEAIPLVVLVNRSSASASEIVAGALKDRGRAALVGEPTFGKGSVQIIHTLSDGSQLRVTHGAWYTPNETPIHREGENIGLQPDVPVSLPADPSAIEPGTDVYREAAIEYLNQKFPPPLFSAQP